MAKKSKTDREWYLEHLIRATQFGGYVTRIYNSYVEEFTRLAERASYNPEKPFSFDDYPGTKEKVGRLMKKISGEIVAYIDRGTRKEWEESQKKNDSLVNRILSRSKLSREQVERFYNHNLEALDQFQKRKVKGMDLSARVWKYTEQFKEEIELGIDVALGEGRSAARLSRDLRSYLKEPEKLFRRVRDKRGNLQLSKNAKVYHPGQGVYRSSYKNAKRLATTEINMAYKAADQARWDNLPFVVGFEVKLSNNHPCNDICDRLAGRYPKDFIFRGWHPHCRCYIVSILANDEEIDKMLDDILDGKEPDIIDSANTVSDVPDGFKDWCKDNASRVKGWSSTPYWIRDNFKEGDLSKGLIIKTITPGILSKPKRKHLPPSKTIKEAEGRISGIYPDVIVDFGSIKKKDISIIDEIRDSLSYHSEMFPEIMKNIQFVGSIKDHHSQLVEALVEKNYGSWLKGVSLGNRKNAENMVRKNILKLPSVKSRSPRSNVNTYAFSDPGYSELKMNGICWNENFGVEKITETLKNDVVKNWHPIGCDNVKSVVDHELGHKLDEILELKTDTDFLKIYTEATNKGFEYIKENLSSYAWRGKDPKAEFIAEAWSEFLNNTDPRPIAKKIGELILDKYKKKYPRSQ